MKCPYIERLKIEERYNPSSFYFLPCCFQSLINFEKSNFIKFFISNHTKGEKAPFRTVPIPLVPPLPPNDLEKPQDPCGKEVENLLDFLLFYCVLLGIAI